VFRGRCAVHRQTTSERGYGADHQAARAQLEATLPASCGYCGVTIERGERWVAAHRVDGKPEAGYVVAHPVCNERAKNRPLPPAPAETSDDVSFVVIG
jgi:hypothetical protein